MKELGSGTLLVVPVMAPETAHLLPSEEPPSRKQVPGPVVPASLHPLAMRSNGLERPPGAEKVPDRMNSVVVPASTTKGVIVPPLAVSPQTQPFTMFVLQRAPPLLSLSSAKNSQLPSVELPLTVSVESEKVSAPAALNNCTEKELMSVFVAVPLTKSMTNVQVPLVVPVVVRVPLAFQLAS